MDIQEYGVDTGGLVIAAIPASMVPMLWEKLVKHIEVPVSMSHNESTVEFIYEQLVTGQMLAVTVSDGTDIEAVNILEVREFCTGLRTLYIPFVAGHRMDEWMDRFLDIAKAIAKDLNCTELRGIAVRKGWLRKLKDYGWEDISTIIKCEV